MRFSSLALFALTGLSLGTPILSKRDTNADVVTLLTDLYATVQIYTGAISTSLPLPALHTILTASCRYHSSDSIPIIFSSRQDSRRAPYRRTNRQNHSRDHGNGGRHQGAPTSYWRRAPGHQFHLFSSCKAASRRHRRRRPARPDHRRNLRDARRSHLSFGRGLTAGVHDADGEFAESVDSHGAVGVKCCTVGGYNAAEYNSDGSCVGGVGAVDGDGVGMGDILPLRAWNLVYAWINSSMVYE